MTTQIDFSTSPEEAAAYGYLSREFCTRLARCWMDVCKELKLDAVKGITSPLICRAHIVLSLALYPDPDVGALFEAWMGKWLYRQPGREDPRNLWMVSCCEVVRFRSIFHMLVRIFPDLEKGVYFSDDNVIDACDEPQEIWGSSSWDAYRFVTRWTQIVHSMVKCFAAPRVCAPDADPNHRCPPDSVCDESLLLVMMSTISAASPDTYARALCLMRDKMRAAVLSSPVPEIDRIAKLEIAPPGLPPSFLKSVWSIRAMWAHPPDGGKVRLLWGMLLARVLQINTESVVTIVSELGEPVVGTAEPTPRGRGALRRSVLHGFNKRPRAAKTNALKKTRAQTLGLKESKKDTRKTAALRIKLRKTKKSKEPEDGVSLGSEDTDEDEEDGSEHESDAEFICDDEAEESHYSSDEPVESPSEAASDSEDEKPRKKRKAK